MKKILIMILSMLLITGAIHATSNYALTFASDGGAGIGIVNKKYTASFLYSTIDNLKGFDEDQTNFEFNTKYRHALDEKSNATIGLRYLLISHKPVNDDDPDENTKLAITLGVDHLLSQRLLMFAETDVYSVQDNDDGKQEDSVFNFARVGLSILF